MEIDTLDVLEAAGTKWNFLPFKPGLVGGHCIGIDPFYLTYKSQILGTYLIFSTENDPGSGNCMTALLFVLHCSTCRKGCVVLPTTSLGAIFRSFACLKLIF